MVILNNSPYKKINDQIIKISDSTGASAQPTEIKIQPKKSITLQTESTTQSIG